MSLANRHRPKTIAELRGQAAIERTLSAAIKNGRLSQAYILTGIRGTGKTTSARIIARAVNCENGPTLEPCGTCHSCRAIDNGSSLDVMEIDAASNTGVDQMRDLISSVAYAPLTPGAFKIYIIDEVHMLSTSSFNALLKTLEEPPAHVMFIFATTELQKIPTTIRSRCSVLSLARISIADIKENLERIAGIEDAKLQPGVASLIARAASGSMRDGISMLEQAISGSNGEVTVAGVAEMIGRASRLKTAKLAHLIAQGDLGLVVAAWHDIIAGGADPFNAIDDIAEWLHQANIFALVPDLYANSDLPEAEVAYLGQIAGTTKQLALAGAVNLLMETTPSMRHAQNGLMLCEMTVVRLTSTFARVNKG